MLCALNRPRWSATNSSSGSTNSLEHSSTPAGLQRCCTSCGCVAATWPLTTCAMYSSCQCLVSRLAPLPVDCPAFCVSSVCITPVWAHVIQHVAVLCTCASASRNGCSHSRTEHSIIALGTAPCHACTTCTCFWPAFETHPCVLS